MSFNASKNFDVLKTFCEFVTSDASECTASTDDGACCTSTAPCALGGGDCDHDYECAGDLVCGTDNCKNFGSASVFYDFDNCCTSGKYSSYNLINGMCDTSKNI